jgi:hypothetical protein
MILAAKLKIEKKGDEIEKKSSPLKLLSQSQPNSAEMILGWSPFKIGTTQGSFQQSLVEIGTVVSEERIFFFHPPFFLICIIGQNRQKFKVHKKSRNIC